MDRREYMRGYRSTETYRAKQRAYRAELRRRGLCLQCMEISLRHSLCLACRQKRNVNKRLRRIRSILLDESAAAV